MSELTIEVEAEVASVPGDRGVPAGLIANEFVTTAIKYAFRNSDGRIKIHFAFAGNSMVLPSQPVACLWAISKERSGSTLPVFS